MKRKIVFVEDDLLLGSLIARSLEENNFEVNYLNTLNGLQETISVFCPHLLILDIEVGNRNCIDELPSIRLNCPAIPIIIASSHTDGEEIVRSRNAGASEYIKKPYDIEELLFHINQLVPENQQIPNANQVLFGNHRLNIRTQELYYNNRLIKRLNPKEFEVLKLLLKQQGEVVKQDELLQAVWGNELYKESLTNVIASLRKHLRADPNMSIQTVRGIGYKLNK